MNKQKKEVDEHFVKCDDRGDHSWTWRICQCACAKCGLTKEINIPLPPGVVDKIKTKESTLLDPLNTINTPKSKIVNKHKNKN